MRGKLFYLLYFVFVLVVVVPLLSQASVAACTTPTNGTAVFANTDTTLCTGIYEINVTVNASDITLNCNASTIKGTGYSSLEWFIFSEDTQNITIRNCVADGDYAGIRADVSNSLIYNNTVIQPPDVGSTGIKMRPGTNIRVEDNTVIDAVTALSSDHATNDNITLLNNNLSVAGQGGSTLILLGSNYTIRGNEIRSNGVSGFKLEDVDSSIIEDNTFFDAHPAMNPMEVDNCSDDNVIRNNTFQNGGCGFDALSCTENNSFYRNAFINLSSNNICGGVDPSNSFNNSGVGNFWDEIKEFGLDLLDTDKDGLYESGSQYPYNKTNGGNVTDNVTDWHPCVYEGCVPPLRIQSPLNTSYRKTWIWFNVSVPGPRDWCGYSLDGGSNVTMSNDTDTHYFANASGLADGPHDATFSCNTSSTTFFNTTAFTVDTTPPVWRNQQHNTSSINQGNALQLAAQGNDSEQLSHAILATNETRMWENKSTYNSPQPLDTANMWTWSNFTWRNASFNNGTVAWKIWYNDTAGNWNATTTLSFNVWSVPPAVTIHQPANTSISDATPQLTVTSNESIHTWLYNVDNQANTSFTPNITLASLADGQHNVTVWANDSVNDVGRAIRHFTVDTTPPQITIHTPKNRSVADATPWLNVTADETVDTWLYELDGNGTNLTFTPNTTLGPLNEGQHNVTVWANDSAGNYNRSRRVFTVDTVSPSIAVQSPQNTTLSDATPWLNVTADEDVDTWLYELDGNGTNVTFQPNTTLASLTDGQHNVTVWANDSAGNWNTSIRYFSVDTIPPTPRIHQPLNDTLSDATPFLNVTATEPIDTWQYNVDTSTNTTFTPNITLGSLAEGRHNVTVWVNDSAGNSNRTTRFFTVDTVLPSITIHTPQNTTLNDATPWLNVTSNESIHTWLYNVDNQANTSFTPNVTVSSLTDGQHNVTVWANDSAGNRNSGKRWFSVDTAAPTLTNNRSNSTAAGSFVRHALRWTDNRELESFVFSFDNGTGSFVNDSAVFFAENRVQNWTNVTKFVNYTGNTLIRWKVFVNDSAGNQNVSDVYSYSTVDVSPPVWRNQQRNVSSVQPGETVELAVQAIDRTNLSHAVLATNESGNWSNKTGNYSSPQRFWQRNNWTWSNFTWQNDSVTDGTTVWWKVWLNDTAANTVATNATRFTVQSETSTSDDDDDDDGGGGGGSSGGGGISFSTGTDVSVSSDAEGGVTVTVSRPEPGKRVAVSLPNETAAGMQSLAVRVNRSDNFTLQFAEASDDTRRLSLTGGRALGFVSVQHNISDEAVTNASFAFGVGKEQVNRSQTGDVALYRYDEGWEALEAALVNTTAKRYVFRAWSPGLSLFAVAVKQPRLVIENSTVADTAITIGDTVEVAVTVANTGGKEGQTTLRLTANNQTVAERQVVVPSHTTQRYTLRWRANLEGIQQLRVNGEPAGTITVSRLQQPANETQREEPQKTSRPSTLLITSILLVLLLAAVTAVWKKETVKKRLSTYTKTTQATANDILHDIQTTFSLKQETDTTNDDTADIKDSIEDTDQVWSAEQED